jgi:hypothetical protein
VPLRDTASGPSSTLAEAVIREARLNSIITNRANHQLIVSYLTFEEKLEECVKWGDRRLLCQVCCQGKKLIVVRRVETQPVLAFN